MIERAEHHCSGPEVVVQGFEKANCYLPEDLKSDGVEVTARPFWKCSQSLLHLDYVVGCNDGAARDPEIV